MATTEATAEAAAKGGETVTVFDHAGSWTEEAYLALPHDRRIELIDGSLLVAPSTDERHAAAVDAVRAAVAEALPEGLDVVGPVALRLAEDRILVPDLAVLRATDEPLGVRDSADALVVIDVVGRGNGVADRWFRPQLYAAARIPYALLIDHDDPFAVANMLIGGRYHEYAQAESGAALRLEEPFPLVVELSRPGDDSAPEVATDDEPGDEPSAEPSAESPAAPLAEVRYIEGPTLDEFPLVPPTAEDSGGTGAERPDDDPAGNDTATPPAGIRAV